MNPIGLITPETIQTGDQIACTGDKRVSGLSGKVIKARRVNLTIETTYFDKPMVLTVRRSDLRGELRAIREGKLLSSLYQSALDKGSES